MNREMKLCKKCRRLLDKSNYPKSCNNKDGLHTWCRECLSAYKKERRKNPEVRERKQRCAREWKKKYPKRNRQHVAKYRAKYHERVRITNANNRAKNKGCKGSFTESEWLRLREKFNSVCPCCGEVVELEIDHIIPISKCGPNTIDNIQPLCASCNSHKHTRTIRYI